MTSYIDTTMETVTRLISCKLCISSLLSQKPQKSYETKRVIQGLDSTLRYAIVKLKKLFSYLVVMQNKFEHFNSTGS